MTRFRVLVILVGLGLVAASCGGGDGADPGAIGPAGGTVSSADGDLTLTIPAGALAEPVEIRLTSPDQVPEVFGDLPPLAVYRMEPDGLQFAAPVGFTLEMDLGTAAPVVFLMSDDTVETVAGGVEVDLDSGTTVATGTLDHFSWIVGHDGPLTVALEDQEPRTKAVGEMWDADTKVISATNFASLQIAEIPFSAGGAVEIVGTESHAGFELASGTERLLDLPVPRWQCASAGSGYYGVSVRAELGGDLISGFLFHLREIGEPLQPVIARNEWAVALTVPIECVASGTTSTTTTSTSTTTTTTTMPEALTTGEVGCEWYRIEYDTVPPEAIRLVVMGDIDILRRDYADLAESLGYGEAPPLPAGPPPLRMWLPPADPALFGGPPGVFPGETWMDTLDRWICGATFHSDGIMQAVSQGATDILGTATAIVDAVESGVEMAFDNTDYPCGQGPLATTLCGELPFPAGETLVVAMALGGPVPAADPEGHYQYGFVFDSDGDPSNDYQASPEFPMDFFDGTDLWYVAWYDPENGWEMGVSGENFAVVPTAARIVVFETGMLLVVPTVEIGDLSTAGYRVTAFRHLGDYGMSPPHEWNGDTLPAVGEPLAGIAPRGE